MDEEKKGGGICSRMSNEEPMDVDEMSDDGDKIESSLSTLEKSIQDDDDEAPSDEIRRNAIILLDKSYKIKDANLIRRSFNLLCGLGPVETEIWITMLTYEFTASNHSKSCFNLFEKALFDCGYANMDLWLLALEAYSTHQSDVEITRELFEKAINTVGFSVSQGLVIWDKYREFERNPVSLTKLYERQFKYPLVGMEKCWDQYLKVNENNQNLKCVPEMIGYLSLKNLAKRVPYEAIFAEEMNNQKTIFRLIGYLNFELRQNFDLGLDKNEMNPVAVCLFERILGILRSNELIWLKYVRYLIEFKSDNAIEMCKTALKFCSSHVPLWIEFVHHLERLGIPNDAISAYNDALQCTFQTSNEYLQIWTCYFGFIRRSTNFSDESSIEYLRCTYQRGVDELCEAFGTEADPSFSLEKFWAHVEARYAKRMDLARKIWQESILIAGTQHERHASYWLEYVQLEKSYGNSDKHVRKVLHRALARCSDRDQVSKELLSFEEQNGTLETYDDAVRLIEFLRKEKKSPEISKIISKAHAPAAPAPPAKRQAHQNVTTNRRLKLETGDMEVISRHAPDPPSNCIFISNLPYDCSESEVMKALSSRLPETGRPLHVHLSINKRMTDKSLGFGHAVFSNKESALNALSLDKQIVLNERQVYLSEYCKKSEERNKFKYPTGLEKCKLFIRNLPATLSEKECSQLFEQFGHLKAVRIVRYRNGQSKGIAYVEFEDEKAAAKALLQMDGTIIPGHESSISVQISNPPANQSKDKNNQDLPNTTILTNDDFRKFLIKKND